MEEMTKENVEVVNEAVENAANKRITELEGRLYIMVEEAINRCEFSEADKKTLKDTIQEAYALGKTSTVVNEESKELFADIKKLFQDALDPEIDKYKQMHLHHQLITSNLLNVASNLLAMTKIQEGAFRPVLGLTSLMGLGPSDTPVFEKQLKS